MHLAPVDEGLLDLTRFKTPDAWNRFYAREAPGVKTWDLYDQVMGAFGSRIERLLALGGDMEAAASKGRRCQGQPVQARGEIPGAVYAGWRLSKPTSLPCRGT